MSDYSKCDSKILTNNVRSFAVAFVVGMGNPVRDTTTAKRIRCIRYIPTEQKKVKKIILLILLLNFSCTVYSQSLMKDSNMKPEGVLGDKITEQLWAQLDPIKVPKCYHKIFSVKFNIDKNGIVNEIKISGNMSEKVIIDIVTKAVKSSESLWNIEECMKYNPNMNFLLPIDLNIFKPVCKLNYNDVDILEA